MANKWRLWRYGAFLVGWILSICFFFVLSVNNDLTPLRQKPCLPSRPDLPSNQFGAFRFVRYYPEEDNKPSFYVSFDNLLVENNKLGIFKSALHQVVRISNLEFKICLCPEESTGAYSSIHNLPPQNNPITQTENRLKKSLQDISPINIFSQARRFINQLSDKQDGWRINLDIPSANVSELVINNFNYSILYGNDVVLSIQSKRAVASYSSSGLILRGHVIIKAGGGNVLEGNHIKWDIDSNIFTVYGVYALNQNGTVRMGRDITLDHALDEIIPKQTVKAYQKGEPKCFAKL